MGAAERDDRGMIGQVECVTNRVLRDTGIARRGMELAQAWRLRQFPRQGVFATAAAQQQDIHGNSFRER